MLDDRDNGLTWDQDRPFCLALIVALARNYHRSQSIIARRKLGHAKDAVPLLRAMFEELGDLIYMERDNDREDALGWFRPGRLTDKLLEKLGLMDPEFIE